MCFTTIKNYYLWSPESYRKFKKKEGSLLVIGGALISLNVVSAYTRRLPSKCDAELFLHPLAGMSALSCVDRKSHVDMIERSLSAVLSLARKCGEGPSCSDSQSKEGLDSAYDLKI